MRLSGNDGEGSFFRAIALAIGVNRDFSERQACRAATKNQRNFRQLSIETLAPIVSLRDNETENQNIFLLSIPDHRKYRHVQKC